MNDTRSTISSGLMLASMMAMSSAVFATGMTTEISIDDEAKLQQAAQDKIKTFSGSLKSKLVTAIQTNGFQSAVNICHSEAPKIAQELSTSGWVLGRTSLQTRNENNQPDTWELANLHRFEDEYQAGVAVAQLKTSATNGQQYRYMQAIPTGKVCLSCHGEQIDPALANTISQLYPKDAATGFKLGDLRGAFTLMKTLDE